MVQAAEQFEQQLETWYAGLPPLIHFSEDLPAEELPYHVRGRVLEIRRFIYAPFLRHAIHAPPDDPYRETVRPFVDKALACSFLSIRGEPKRHRHHGTWYNIRNVAVCCLFIIGAARSGTIPLGGDWKEPVRSAVKRMRYWVREGPGVGRCIEVIESYLDDTG
ncbi:hypothetical protein VTK73DRAFT_10255 [Phialemonium thermophilum]|uniref:Uncharacterized protein n=1 Tax=Phialemonium thermophilum TaxID=223376 RepID=A0ABR3VXM2_9PEZI